MLKNIILSFIILFSALLITGCLKKEKSCENCCKNDFSKSNEENKSKEINMQDELKIDEKDIVVLEEEFVENEEK